MSALFSVLIIPVIGTTIGAAFVYTIKDTIPPLTKKAFMGFTAGVMIAAAVWSLLIPAMNMSGGEGVSRTMPAILGFTAGVAFLLVMDSIIPHQHGNDSSYEGLNCDMSRTWKLVLAIILHNIPEGMAIGVAFAAVAEGSACMPVAGALALAVGIAIQNVPEGAIVSLPLRDAGNTKTALSSSEYLAVWFSRQRHCSRYGLPPLLFRLCLSCLRLQQEQCSMSW